MRSPAFFIFRIIHLISVVKIMSSMREKYLTGVVFPNALKFGRFGAGMKFLRFENDDTNKGMQFASSLVFINAIFYKSSGDGEEKEQKFRLVVKFLPDSPMAKVELNSIAQFHNETVMYSDILPFLDYNDIVPGLFPKFYYGESSNSDGKEPVIIVENLSVENFKLSKFQFHLDYYHLIISLKALGKFHALSYIAKQKHPKEFDKIKSKLKEHILDNRERNAFFVYGPCALRGVYELNGVKKSETLRLLIDRLKKENSSYELASYFLEPEEPMAVICHGDFCNHNLLFRYDSIHPDVPSSVKFIDLQTSRYSSPVIDLSMLLNLNVESELRSYHWKEFINVYYKSVSETVSAANCIPPAYDQLINEINNKFFYGYFMCSWFLPFAKGEAITPATAENYSKLSRDEILELYSTAGSENTKQAIFSMIKHLDEYNYFGFLNK